MGEVTKQKNDGGIVRTEEKKKNAHLGFLTALGNSHNGVIGGFLVLNMSGRPVEFHCTSPVRPNRAQEILYGETLDSFVCGEQIAPALVGRAKIELAAVLTNDPNMLPAIQLLNAPLGIVLRHVNNSDIKTESDVGRSPTEFDKNLNAMAESSFSDSPSSGSTDQRLLDCKKNDDPFFYDTLSALPFVPGVDYSCWRETICGRNRLALPTCFVTESHEKVSFEECVSRITPFLKSIDSMEPFERIRLAVEEAQKSN